MQFRFLGSRTGVSICAAALAGAAIMALARAAGPGPAPPTRAEPRNVTAPAKPVAPAPSATPANQATYPVNGNLFKALQWRGIGPYRGGRALAVAGIPGDPNTFFFGAVAGGVWKTTSAGTTWYPVFDDVREVSSVGAIEVAPSQPDVIYVGTGEPDIRGQHSTEILLEPESDGVFEGKRYRRCAESSRRNSSQVWILRQGLIVILPGLDGCPWCSCYFGEGNRIVRRWRGWVVVLR